MSAQIREMTVPFHAGNAMNQQTRLTEAEWGLVEHLAQCYCLANDVFDLDEGRFRAKITELQEQVLALPTRRAMGTLPSNPSLGHPKGIL
jgi:hypothetical protein